MLDFNSCSKTTSLCFQGLGFGVLSRAGSPLPVFPASPDPRVQAGVYLLWQVSTLQKGGFYTPGDQEMRWGVTGPR